MACAAGLAVIDYIEKHDILTEALRKGHIFLNEFASEKRIQGRGMVWALIFDSKKRADEIIIEAAKRGLLLIHTGKHTVKIAPPLTIPDRQLIKGIGILREVLK